MILYSIIHYNNEKEVLSFLEHIADISVGFCYHVIITDNSCSLNDKKASLLAASNVTLFQPGTNLGYLNGCYEGLRFWNKSNSLMVPKFIIVCNTDLEFESDFVRVLNSKVYDTEVACICPDVRLRNGVRQNPNIMIRPSLFWIYKMNLIYKFEYFGSLYIYLSRIKRKLVMRKNQLIVNSGVIYAGHGSIWIFNNRGYDISRLHFDGFMQDEELHVAEEIRLKKRLVYYDKDLKVVHHEHSTTKFISLRTNSRWHKESFGLIKKRYFTR